MDKRRLFLMEQGFATLFALINKLQMNADKSLCLLTSRQLMAMIAILHLPGNQASLKNVASKLGNSKQSTKHIVASLEQKGYVKIESNPEDHRSITIVITTQGYEVLEADAMRGYAFFDEIFRGFTNEELYILWQTLQKLYRYDGKEHDGFEAAASENLPPKL